MKIPVDSPLVMRNSRHSITEAGFDTIIDNLRKAERDGDTDRSKSGVLSYQGAGKAGRPRPTVPPFRAPNGGRAKPGTSTSTRARCCRAWSSPRIRAEQLIERYVYREIRENPTELAAAGAFEPDQRWGESKGLLTRFARAATGSDLPSRQRFDDALTAKVTRNQALVAIRHQLAARIRQNCKHQSCNELPL